MIFIFSASTIITTITRTVIIIFAITSITVNTHTITAITIMFNTTILYNN